MGLICIYKMIRKMLYKIDLGCKTYVESCNILRQGKNDISKHYWNQTSTKHCTPVSDLFVVLSLKSKIF